MEAAAALVPLRDAGDEHAGASRAAAGDELSHEGAADASSLSPWCQVDGAFPCASVGGTLLPAMALGLQP